MRHDELLKTASLSKEELLAIASGNLVSDAPADFMRLPSPPMLMFDRVTSIERNGPRGRIVAEQDIHADAWFFQCHFRGDPVQPGCLGVDAVWQLIGLYCGLNGALGSGRALGCKEVEFAGQIRPFDTLVRYEVDIRRFSLLKESGAAVAIANGRVFVDGEQVYSITDAKVGMFTGIAYADYPARSANSRGGVMKARGP
jgi:3-hydroxyacyl-[acyl-carrier protein] dehydratase/trans-2-decenoyl-[acyl-carrier protein] isomerase